MPPPRNPGASGSKLVLLNVRQPSSRQKSIQNFTYLTSFTYQNIRLEMERSMALASGLRPVQSKLEQLKFQDVTGLKDS